jgi:HK97 family phage major capsid protein
MDLLAQYQTERDGLVAVIDRTLDIEGRDLSDVEQRSITDARSRIEAIDAQIALVSGALQTRDAGADLTRMLNRADRRDAAPVAETRSWGDQFVSNGVFEEYRGRGTSPMVGVETRALPTGLSDVADVLAPAQRVNVAPSFMTPLLDAIGTIDVSGNSIEVVTWSKVGGAAKVAEKSPKPGIEYVPAVVPHVLDTIAGYTQLTRQLIEDAPAVRSAIDTELRRDVIRKMESEAAAALVAATLPTATSTVSLLAAIRAGVGKVQAEGYVPNVVILNPADWADMDIDVFGGTLAGPVVGQRFWGLTPIAANSQPAGTATVGDLSAGVQRYARTGVNLYVTDSHAETFLSNVFTLLAEARAKTVVTRPAALVECSKV